MLIKSIYISLFLKLRKKKNKIVQHTTFLKENKRNLHCIKILRTENDMLLTAIITICKIW